MCYILNNVIQKSNIKFSTPYFNNTFSLSLRLWQLGSVPISMSDDELRLVYTGYSIAHNGKDAFGNFLPIVFHMDGASTYGQVPIYISSLFFLFFPLNSFVARLPFALAGIFSIVFIYFIVKKIFNNDKIASYILCIICFCLGRLHFTRFAIEVDIAVVLYLAGMLSFLYSRKNIKLFLLSMLLFFLAFYTYAATKVIFIPLMLVLLWYRLRDLTRREIFIMVATTIIAFGSFFYLSVTQGASIILPQKVSLFSS